MAYQFSPSSSSPPLSPTAPPPYVGAGPDGVLRAELIADDALGPRLCRGALLTPGWMLRQSLPAAVGALVAAVAASSTDSRPPAVVTVVVVLGLFLLAQATMLTLGIALGQRRMRRIMPAGTPVGAEFTPVVDRAPGGSDLLADSARTVRSGRGQLAGGAALHGPAHRRAVTAGTGATAGDRRLPGPLPATWIPAPMTAMLSRAGRPDATRT
ncbi:MULTISPECIES: hypothetical protein [unclassified Gordonia (in: high G+C Gram-positive bacteria)]|uniref:hypothetical protein n=1 Tax=unclassified Gordonia (in: high G+C Gram-positive bacteria) TaxID=2657482 RepID=UPI00209BB22C|nr:MULTISPECIES: hypothetical protein [unclassified Gordonia (in: high G+C Gram-positive bacteria)]MDF3283990.1 hypothetical protein [Gordonia sp. N1V]